MTNFLNLQLFAGEPLDASAIKVTPVNVTTQNSMSPTMKTFYDTTLLENARENMVFTQFGKRQPMKGNKVEWRKFNTFAKALTPLTEGVIPTGQTFGMTTVEGTINQHGDFTAVTDRLELESYDDVIFGATEEMGAAEGETYDTLTRNVLVGVKSIAWCPKEGGAAPESDDEITNENLLTPEMVHKVAVHLKKMKAPKIDGSYVALIHPSVAFDLRNNPKWEEYHKHTNPAPIFKGETGELFGVRFIETNEALVQKNASGKSVYSTIFLGRDAFGILDPEGEGMEMIIKTKGQIGGPLEQFSTIGYKFCHGAAILYPERMMNVVSGSSLGNEDNANDDGIDIEKGKE